MDIRAVDLNLLKAFDALMNERAVTRGPGGSGCRSRDEPRPVAAQKPLRRDLSCAPRPTWSRRRGARDRALGCDGDRAYRGGAEPRDGFDRRRARRSSPPAWPNTPRSRSLGSSPGVSREAPSATLRLLPASGGNIAEQLTAARSTSRSRISRISGAYRLDGIAARPVRRRRRRASRDGGSPCRSKTMRPAACAVSPRGKTSGALDRSSSISG